MTVSGYLRMHKLAKIAQCENVFPFQTGKIRLQSLVRPSVIKINAPLTTVSPKYKTEKTPAPLMPSMTTGEDKIYDTLSKPLSLIK